MSTFETAISYVLENEGVDFDHPNDHGGRTRYGITEVVAAKHGRDVRTLTLADAKAIYRSDYWQFDGIRDARLAAKLLDIVVNFGVRGGTKIIQRAAGVLEDGVYGPKTEAALVKLPSEDAIERLSKAQADRYVDICISDRSQWVFLKGWTRRAIRRPPLLIKGV